MFRELTLLSKYFKYISVYIILFSKTNKITNIHKQMKKNVNSFIRSFYSKSCLIFANIVLWQRDGLRAQYWVQEDVINRDRQNYYSIKQDHKHQSQTISDRLHRWVQANLQFVTHWPLHLWWSKIKRSMHFGTIIELHYISSISVPRSDADELCQCVLCTLHQAFWAKKKQIIGLSGSQTLKT